MFGRPKKRNDGVRVDDVVHFRSWQRTTSSRRANVLGSMFTIRTLLRRRGYNVDHCSDEEIADALVEVCAGATQLGLSPQHLIVAAERLTEAASKR